MRENNILFICVDLTDYEIKFVYSLGGGYIQSFLKSKGIDSIQFKPTQESYSLGMIVDQILSYNIPVIGFTCVERNYPYIAMLSNALKSRKKDILIVVGGPGPTFSDEIILNHCNAIDICVRGEGEYIVYDLLEAIEKAAGFEKVKGVSYRKNGRVVKTPLRELIDSGIPGAELDIIPSPYLTGVIPREEGADVSIITSRGCPYKCIYCNFSVIGRQTIRFHSPERVVQELSLIWEANKDLGDPSKRIYIWDDAFTIHRKRTTEICKKIIAADLKGINIWAETRADRIDREILRLLRNAGIKMLGIGLETVIPSVMSKIQKIRARDEGENDGYALEKKYISCVKEMVNYGKKLGIDMQVSMIQGLPGDSYEGVKKTVKFINSLKIKTVYQNSLFVYPGTKLFIESKKYGMKLKITYMASLHYNIINPPAGFYYPAAFLKHKSVQFYNDMLSYLNTWRFFCDALLPVSNEYVYDIVIVNTVRFPAGFFKWFAKEGNINATVSFLGKGFCRKDIEENHNAIIKYGFLLEQGGGFFPDPVDPIGYLIQRNSLYGHQILITGREYFKMVNPDNRLLPRFHLFQLRHFFKQNLAEISDDKHQNYIIFKIDNEDDIKILLKMAGMVKKTGKFVIKKSLNQFAPSLKDECRWLDKPCPAIRLSRVIVNDKGEILPCINGRPVGKLGESAMRIRKRLESLMEKEKKLRGCADCSVREHCSKCLYPYPLDRDEYCRVRREYPYLHKIALFMQIPRLFLWNLNIRFKPGRLVAYAPTFSEQKTDKLKNYSEYSGHSKFVSLRKKFNKFKKMGNNILTFKWGGDCFIGRRLKSLSGVMQVEVMILPVSQQAMDLSLLILSRNNINEVFAHLEDEYSVDRNFFEQIENLIDFLIKIEHKP